MSEIHNISAVLSQVSSLVTMLRISIHHDRANPLGKLMIWGKQVFKASFVFHGCSPTTYAKLFSIKSSTITTTTISLSHRFKALENKTFSSTARNITSYVSNIPASAIETRTTSAKTTRRRKWLGDDTFLRLLKIYKGIYNHIEIPATFTIPTDSNWPVEYHGYKLGNKVALLRRTQRYIASDFKSELDSLGFLWKPNDYRFHKVDLALQTYKKLHGDLKIKEAFVVPSDSPNWPKMLWGFSLGKTVGHIRSGLTFKEKRKYFEEMGFIYEKQRTKLSFADIKEAIKVYKKNQDTSVIPSSFIIDQDDINYAPSMRGVALGRIVFEILRRDLFPENREELTKMISLPLRRWPFNSIYQASQCYKNIYGSLSNVPKKYTIPEGSAEFPSHFWGIRLGKTLYNIKHKGAYKAYYDQLRELGVFSPIESSCTSKTSTNLDSDSTAANDVQNTSNDSVSAANANGKPSLLPIRKPMWFGNDTYLRLLKIYKRIYNHMEIPLAFKIPKDSNWPVEYHGYKLGEKVTFIRNRQSNIARDFKSELDSLGFIWNANDQRFHKVDLALQTYKKLHGDLKIKEAFVVPSDSPDWPEILWGFRLGGVVQVIRRRNAYPEKRKYFEEMGFIYEKQPKTNFSFADIKKAIEVYKARYKTSDIPYSYNIGTDDKDFPVNMRGAKLGVIIKNILHNNHYSQHHKKLEKMGFQILPKMQLQFNRKYEAMQIYKKIYGSLSNVPKKYTIPAGSAEFPPHLWGLKLGPLLERIKYGLAFKDYYDQLRELGVPLPSEREKEENPH